MKPSSVCLSALSVCALFASPSIARAGTTTVPGDFPTIQAAVDASTDGDEILLTASSYTENVNTLGKAITIRGTGPTNTTLSPSGAGSVFTFNSGEGRGTSIRDLTIRDGNALNGGAILCTGASPTIRNIRFLSNHATGTNPSNEGGGAIANFAGSEPLIDACSFFGNTAESLGGAILNFGSSSAVIVNCVLANNSAFFGGAIANEQQSDALMANCTVVNNDAPIAPGICNFASAASVVSCIVRDNGDDDVLNITPGSGSVVRYSNTSSDEEGEGNINADPLFASAGPSAGYTLAPGSPCIDAGDSGALPPGIVLDAYGAPRFTDDASTQDTGAGGAPIVDMGASEFQTAPCPADCDTNGTVVFADLVCMLFRFGAPDADAGTDCNGDTTVDFADLVCALFAFGPYPG